MRRVSRSRIARAAFLLLLLSGILPVLTNDDVELTAVLPGLLMMALLCCVLFVLVPRHLDRNPTGAAAHENARRLWGDGPVSWVVGTDGFDQIGVNGRLDRVAWSSVSGVDVDDLVVVLRSGRLPLTVIPLEAFDEGQLPRMLGWFETAGGPGVRRSTVQMATAPDADATGSGGPSSSSTPSWR